MASLVRVVDGDSLWVRDRNGKRHELRLSAIDAPERKQAGGDEATKALRKLLGDQPLRVTTSQTDRYKRHIAHIRVGQRDVSEQMLSAGHAWYYRRFKRTLTPLRREAYDRAETRAKTQRRGLWSQTKPVAPWLYRQQQRRQQKR